MGRRAATCLMDLSDHAMTVNRRDAFHHDLWGQGCNPPRGKLPNAENELLHSNRQWKSAEGEPRSNRGKKRKSNDPISLLPPEAQVGVWCQCEDEAIGTGGFSVKENCGCCQGPILGKARIQLGRTFRITSVARIGAYYLDDSNEKAVSRPWNVNNLKRYYY